MKNIFKTAATILVFCWLIPCDLRAADREEIYYNVVVSLVNAGKWQDAVKKIEEREKTNLAAPMRARYLYAKALAYEQGKQLPKARGTFQQLLQKHAQSPEAATARTAIIYLDYDTGNLDAVLSAYAKLDKKSLAKEQQRDLALIFAESLYTKGQAKPALAAYQKAVALGTDAKTIAPRLLDLYLQLGMHQPLLTHSANGVPGAPADLVSLVRAEAMLALSQWAAAATEAAKVPANSTYHPRAAFARAQALLKTGKTKDAIAPLQAAIKGLKDPVAPPTAHVALTECLTDHKQFGPARTALAAARTAIAKLPAAEKTPLSQKLALLEIRIASESGDDKLVIEALARNRKLLPKDQLAAAVYLRLHALSKLKNHAAILATLAGDYPLLHKTPNDGSATFIYSTSLKASKREKEAKTILEGYLGRESKSSLASRVRLELSTLALAAENLTDAAKWLDQILATGAAHLDKQTMAETRYNRAVVAMRQEKLDVAVGHLQPLTAAGSSVQAKAAKLLKDVYHSQAVAKFNAKDYSAACDQLAALAKQAGGAEKLSQASAELWSRALFHAGRFEQAAQQFTSLHTRFKDKPAYAYEAAVAFEKLEKLVEAEKSYLAAKKDRERLPADYAKAVDANLAAVQLRGRTGDWGQVYWTSQLAPNTEAAGFETAAAALRAIARSEKLTPDSGTQLNQFVQDYPKQQQRRCTAGSLVLSAWWQTARAQKQDAEKMAELAKQLVADFEEHENQIDAKSTGATVSMAMTYFFLGEAERLRGNVVDALVAYEIVLADFPYNEWPDAAACGAADCFAELGDKETAKVKFQEVTQSKLPAAARWIEYAKKRLVDLK